ncbi:MAG: cytochrome D1 domain-containing protein [Porticoccus sp.]|nr:cytochrome D1 domain-containing protein [Porticoccus sp.]
MNSGHTIKTTLLTLVFLAFTCISIDSLACATTPRGTGDLGVVVERENGSLLVVEHSSDQVLCRIEGLGDLSHASAVYSRDARYAYIFGRDGGLTKVDILNGTIVKRVIQAGNSIGGAISQDGSLIAVSNYVPGGVKIFNSLDLSLVADIPATIPDSTEQSKTVGLVDAPGQKFIFSLFEGASTWVADLSNPAQPKITKFEQIGKQPYDALISGDGRYYIAGLFGEDGLAMLDLWQPDKGMRRILSGYSRGHDKLPVYKMPHLEGWAVAGESIFLPAMGLHQVLVVDKNTWEESGRIELKGQPVFAIARPDGRQVWVNFAYPDNNWIQVIDVPSLEVIKTLDVGKGALHMEFTPRGEKVWISVRDKDQIKVFDTETLSLIKTIKADKPSGIFFSNRAGKIGL